MIIKRKDSFNFVCAIGGYSNNKQTLIGTGLFISKDNKYYVLTAEHVIKTSITPTYIVLSDNNLNPCPLPLSQLNKNTTWRTHPIADMAVLEIDSTLNTWITSRAFPFDHCEISMANFGRDVEMTTVGFPCGLGITGTFSPLTFRSFPASEIIQLPRLDNKSIITDVFLLEDPSIGGYSGGPVFDLGYKVDYNMTQTKDKTRLYGIMHGYIGGSNGRQMSFVTPISYLNQLI